MHHHRAIGQEQGRTGGKVGLMSKRLPGLPMGGAQGGQQHSGGKDEHSR